MMTTKLVVRATLIEIVEALQQIRVRLDQLTADGFRSTSTRVELDKFQIEMAKANIEIALQSLRKIIKRRTRGAQES